jgi:mannose-1-phosphate guanylyltransferase
MPTDHEYGLILAGGRGTRFWPRSRRTRAKQVLPIAGEQTMIQATVERLRPQIPPERIWIITNSHLRDEIARQLPDIPERQIIAEPAQRNTAAAIGLAAAILANQDPEAVMGVFPSDHVITKPKRYLRIVKQAFRSANEGRLMVLGIQPRYAETGFGYIEFPKDTEAGSLRTSAVKSFREKPDAATAKKYVKAGRFYWNAGMFFWRASVFLDELRQHLPKTATLLSSLPAFGSPDFETALAEAFPKCENISIDYGVIEKSARVSGFACDEFGWSDVGSWNAVYDLMAKDKSANVVRGNLLALDSRGNYVDSAGKLVALVGIENMIVVDTPDALLIVPRDQAQKVGDLVKALEQQRRDDLL